MYFTFVSDVNIAFYTSKHSRIEYVSLNISQYVNFKQPPSQLSIPLTYSRHPETTIGNKSPYRKPQISRSILFRLFPFCSKLDIFPFASRI